jgi:hypothetical protein
VIHASSDKRSTFQLFLDDKLKRFYDLVIQDSTIIQLHESLAKVLPAAINNF